MAKQQTSQPEHPKAGDSDHISDRAWELFARNVNVTGQRTVTHEKLAENCWEAAEAFESFMNPKPKG
jgi:hypothetical protein